jgi:hypothetical protein
MTSVKLHAGVRLPHAVGAEGYCAKEIQDDEITVLMSFSSSWLYIDAGMVQIM